MGGRQVHLPFRREPGTPRASRLRALGRDRRGVVMVEFLIVIVPILVLFLGILQLALLTGARLVVRHAASTGVRAAVVVLADDPRHYDGVLPGDIADGSDRDAGRVEQGLAATFGQDAPPIAPLGGPRMADIRRAVQARLLPLAQPGLVKLALDRATVAGSLGNNHLARIAVGLATTPGLTSVTFPTAPGADTLEQERAGDGETVTLRVTYAMPCMVPVARRILCSPLSWNVFKKQLRVPADSDAAHARALSELNLAPDKNLRMLLAISGVPVALLQAEATLPHQRAAYSYQVDEGAKR